MTFGNRQRWSVGRAFLVEPIFSARGNLSTFGRARQKLSRKISATLVVVGHFHSVDKSIRFAAADCSALNSSIID